ncbi:hypothetical protein [uncultured Thiodictyon sp.]|jgi:hypothetical protein|uniref:hypothetical protein n=1 Tax=uncultured Thiodictyon sp. TaxID=1846217 RepID=UPI0025FB9A3F|nr:hypothetical protein [uncultured Thiodictyon sp.]
MYTSPLHCRNQRTASKARTLRPSQAATRHSIERDLKVADMIARAIQDNASQLYRGA